MLHERLGIVLKSAMDGKGKRRDTNVRSVVAAKLQAVLKSREVCIDLVIELVSKLRFIVVFSRHRNGKDETYNRTRGSTALAHDAAYSPHAQGGQGGVPLRLRAQACRIGAAEPYGVAERLRPFKSRERLEALLQEATGKQMSFADFLDCVLTEEVVSKTAKNVEQPTWCRFPWTSSWLRLM